jgi:2-keto-3-deoxy-L-rhamnonate aldolase RhmA
MTKLASLENNFEGVGSGDISGEHVVRADRHPPLTIRSSFTNAAIMRSRLDALESTNKTPTLFLP